MFFAGVTRYVAGRYFNAFRDVTAWWVLEQGKQQKFRAGEVDMDAKKTMVDRSSLAASGEAVHVGRLFVMRERCSGRIKVTALQDMAVPRGTALPPEDNADIKSTVTASMLPGSVGSGDGGKAIKSSVKASAGGKVPLIYAQHGKTPKAQYTKLAKLDTASLAPELLEFFAQQGRLAEGSSSTCRGPKHSKHTYTQNYITLSAKIQPQ